MGQCSISESGATVTSMPFLFFALLGLGVFVVSRSKATAAPTPPTPPNPPVTASTAYATRDASGTLVATKDGATLALHRLLRYGPAVYPASSAPLIAGGALAIATKKFAGAIGTSGVAPVSVTETAVGWIQDELLATPAQYVLVREDLLVPIPVTGGALADPGLPATTALLAVSPRDPPALAAQLGSLMVPGAGWVLLNSDTLQTASEVSGWPDTVSDFIALV